MKNITYSIMLVLIATCVSAAQRSWSFGDGTVLRMKLPDLALVEQVSPSSDTERQAFTIRYPDSNGISTISYQFLVAKSQESTDWSTSEKIDAFLLRAGRMGLRGSVEKELKPLHLKMATGAGSYLVFTDADLVGQAISRPGTFRHMTMVACGINGYTIFVRGYANSTTEGYFTDIHEMIKSAEILPASRN